VEDFDSFGTDQSFDYCIDRFVERVNSVRRSLTFQRDGSHGALNLRVRSKNNFISIPATSPSEAF
jgi:hypothetical protein